MPWRCEICGETHDELPLVFGAEAPWWLFVPDEEFAQRVELEHSLCVVDQQYFFARGHIQIPIRGTDEHFIWSVWCSVSEDSFVRMMDDWNNPSRTESEAYFGWLYTEIPTYEPSTLRLKTMLYEREPGVVPLVQLWSTEHPLAMAQREGITMREAETLVHRLMHVSNLDG